MALERFHLAQTFVESQSDFSRFEVLELIGTGSNGIVFKCRSKDPRVVGDFALKVIINYGTDPQVLLSSAVQEQSAISYLPPHRNIVEIFGIVGPAPIPQQIFDLCPDLMQQASSRNDAVGIVMRYHPQDLDLYLTKHRDSRQLSAYDLLGMCLDVLLALRHLQRYRSLHFDVKLNNFLVARDLTLVLADFGCAQQTTRDDWTVPLDSDSTNLGNTSHLAPEVLRALQNASPNTPGGPKASDSDSSDGGAGGSPKHDGGDGGGGHGGGSRSTAKRSRYFLPCRRQLEFAAGILLFELLFSKGHPYGTYPLNFQQLVPDPAPAGDKACGPRSPTTQVKAQKLVAELEAEMDARIEGLRGKMGFTAQQQRVLRQVIRGLVRLDPQERMPLREAVRIMGAVDKNPSADADADDDEQGGESLKDAAAAAAKSRRESNEALEQTDRLLEVWVLGPSYVGKSLLMSVFTGSKYQPVTVGVNSGWRNVRPGMPNGFQVRVWDTAGQRIFRNSMAGLTSRDAFVVLVFDVTSEASFNELREIHHQLKEKGRMATCVVVANKTDLVDERKVTYKQGLQLAIDLGAEGYFETSAQLEEGVNELFLSIFQIADRLERIMPKRKKNKGRAASEEVTVVGTPVGREKPRGCCG